MAVLEKIVQAMSNKEIGVALNISAVTVKAHMNALMEKMGVADRTQAATAAIQRGIVSLDSVKLGGRWRIVWASEHPTSIPSKD